MVVSFFVNVLIQQVDLDMNKLKYSRKYITQMIIPVIHENVWGPKKLRMNPEIAYTTIITIVPFQIMINPFLQKET